MSKNILTLTGIKTPIANGGLNWDFVVNTSVNYVETNYIQTEAKWMSLVKPCTGSTWIVQGGQCFLIKSLGVVMPAMFSLFEHNLEMTFLKVDNDGTYYIESLLDYQCLPSENYELEINRFIDMSQYVLTTGYSVIMSLVRPFKVSMIGVPAALNGLTFSIKPFVKVELQ